MIQRIKLHRSQILTSGELFKLCASARNTHDYIRITLWTGKYVQVNFHRDNTLSVSTNRMDLSTLYAVNNMMQRNKIYSTENVVEFLFKFIQKNTKYNPRS